MHYYNRDTIQKHLESFKSWLNDRGAEVLQPCNESEIIRFRCSKELHIITANYKGVLKFGGDSLFIFESFRNGENWRACKSTPRSSLVQRGSRMHAILERDGDLCFFCQKPVGKDEHSEEHLCARTFGGPNHIANIVLAHSSCNSSVGALSVMEKINLHVQAKLERLQQRIDDLDRILADQSKSTR